MKKFLFTLLLAVLTLSVPAQKLLDSYKKGTVRLVPDTEYAVGNDWNKVFSTYNDTLYGKFMGDRKSLKIMPDGSVVVNHAYRDFYTKFSPKGVFEKEFGIKNSKGVLFKKINGISGIINNNTFYTGLDNMGNMICFDFNGNYVKTLKLDYMTRQMIPLPNHKIAVVGWVIWATKFRDFVSIVDYETNSEKVIWEHFANRSDVVVYGYNFKERGAISVGTSASSTRISMSSPPQIACVGDKLIVASPTTGEILVYDVEGTLKSKGKIGLPVNYVSVEDQKKRLQSSIDRYKSNESPMMASGVSAEEIKMAQESIVKQMETDLPKITEPEPLPIFSTIIQDSDNNLLFFEYPKEENANKFHVWVYENNGSFVCQSSFVCDDYKLEISPSKMVFYKGYIYGLQLLKNAPGVPLRLVRFKLTNE